MHQFISAILYSVAGALTPGPNNFMLLSAGMKYGLQQSWRHFAGVFLGVAFLALCVGLGIGTLFDQFHWLKPTLKITGAAYMLYLAWKITQSDSAKSSKKIAKPMTFFQAVAFQWVNVKAIIFIIGANSLFTLSRDHIMNAIFLAIISMATSILCSGLWWVMGKTLQKLLRTEQHQKVFNYVMGLLLSFSVLLIFLE